MAGRFHLGRRLADFRTTALYGVERTTAAFCFSLPDRAKQKTGVGSTPTEGNQHERGHNDSDDPVHISMLKPEAKRSKTILEYPGQFESDIRNSSRCLFAEASPVFLRSGIRDELKTLSGDPLSFRLVARTSNNRKPGVFRKLWVIGGPLALIERGAASRLDLSHVLAVTAQPNAFRLSFRGFHHG